MKRLFLVAVGVALYGLATSALVQSAAREQQLSPPDLGLSNLAPTALPVLNITPTPAPYARVPDPWAAAVASAIAARAQEAVAPFLLTSPQPGEAGAGVPGADAGEDHITHTTYPADPYTDLSKVPDAAAILWAAYTPRPAATKVPGVQGSGKFIWPLRGALTQGFSWRHMAIDIATGSGEEVVAADTGTVVFSGIDYGGLGLALLIDHGNRWMSAYGHASKLLAKPGEIVTRGQKIALVGSTGHSTGPHLHFALHQGPQAVDPLELLMRDAPSAPPPNVIVPDFKGFNPSELERKATSLRLTVVRLPNISSTYVPADQLMSVNPRAGTLLPIGSIITVVYSSGPATPTPTASSTPSVSATASLSPRPTTTGTPSALPSTTPTPSRTTNPSGAGTPTSSTSPTPTRTLSPGSHGSGAPALATPTPTRTSPHGPGYEPFKL